MKRCLVEMSLIACGALMATHAVAQSDGRAAAKKTQTAAANVAKAAKPTLAAVTSIAAAGSVIVLADGIVANATVAQIQAPADGFVYER